MRFWKVVVHDFADESEKTVWWFTRKRDAEREERQHGSASCYPVDVPTDRKGLLDFLEQHIWRG